MKKYCFLFLCFTFSTSAMADCQYFDGVKSSQIKDGESVSLRDPGKSLENMKIQDQDGLGTCYANTTSTMLKSILPDSPDLSYTHAAVMGTTRGWAEDWSGPNNKYLNKNNSQDNFTSYGWVCETLAGLKNAGGACPQNLSAPESHEIWDANAQNRLLHGLGLYFDNMNLIKDDPAKYAQLKNDLSLAIEAISLEKLSLTEKCEERRSPKFPVYETVTQMLQDALYDDIIEPTNCTKSKTNAVKALLSPESVIESDRVLVVPSSETIKSFSEMLTNEPDLAQELEEFMADPDASLAKKPEFSKRMGEKFNALLMKLIPDEDIRKDCPESVDGKSVMIKDDVISNVQSFLYQVKYQKTNPCTDLLLYNDLDRLLNPTKNKKSCLAQTSIEPLLAALKPLMEINTEINKDLIPILLNPESRYASQIVKAIMPGCLNKDQLINLDHLACGTFPMCDPTGRFNDNNTYSGPKGGCYTLDYAKKMMRTKSMIAINSGRAVGVGVCTAFLKDPKVKTNFCTSPLPDGKSHSLHEMTVSGYRCTGDKIEYEVINSWGTNCTSNDNIDCQKDKYGDTTGPFWVKEDALVDNSKDMTSISEKK